MQLHFHCIGIGGIGMSAVARLLIAQGHIVSGCDAQTSNTTQKLITEGCAVYTPNGTPSCFNKGITHYIYSSSIQESNPEIQHAKHNNIPCWHRSQAVAYATQKQKRICITGSHGKTTTTSLVAHILSELNVDPTIVAGGILEKNKSNAQQGNGPYAVIEADESDKSFFNTPPFIAAITNTDHEHHETYPTLQNLQKTFTDFFKKVPKHGTVILNLDDIQSQPILKEKFSSQVLTTSTSTQPADLQACNISPIPDKLATQFMLFFKNKEIGTVFIPLLGTYNVSNTLTALACVHAAGYSLSHAITTLTNFRGVQQRFSLSGTLASGTPIYDDYAHHPAEIKHALQTARLITKNRLYVFFQPQRYSRTKHLWHDFITCFSTSTADTVIISDIYSAHEHNNSHWVSGENLTEEIKKTHPKTYYLKSTDNYKDLISYIRNLSLTPNDTLLFLGAGKIQSIIPIIKNP